MRSDAERNLAAEVRAVEEGHRAVELDVNTFRVVSDTRPGKHYVVTVGGWRDGDAVFRCTPRGDGAYGDDHRDTTTVGVVPCKHAAVAARRLEREGTLALNDVGRWSVIAGPEAPVVDDDEATAMRLARYRRAGRA